MNENGETNKFSEAEIILGGFFAFGVDFTCILLDLTIVGAFITPVIQGFVTFIMWMWFKSKGDQGSGKISRQIAKYSANVLPVVPTNFIVFLIEAFIHNHPKAAQFAGQTAGTVVGAAFGGPAGARVGGAIGQYAAGGSATEAATGAVPTKVPLKKIPLKKTA